MTTEAPDIREHIISKDKVMQFMLAGKAHFVLWNQVSGNRFEYRVEKHPDKDLWFVKLCTKSEDVLLATLMYNFGDTGDILFRGYSKLPLIWLNSNQYAAVDWYIRHLQKGDVPDTVVVYHLGTCGACGKPLKDPLSLSLGIGPYCRGKR